VLAGKAVMVNWSNVGPADRHAYRQWHTAEHMTGRLSVPGFIRGRRYGAVTASRDILVCYEIEDTDVIASEAYRHKAKEPIGPLRSGLSVTDGVRNIAVVKHSLGLGVGGYALTLRLEVRAGAEDAFTSHLVGEALPAVARMGEITGAHFCLGDAEVSAIVPGYLQGRLAAGPRWIVMVEGMTLEALREAFDTHLVGLDRHGCSGPITPDTYQLEVMMTR
jgi:hypothetical protein